MTKKELVQAIKDNRLADHIARNYWNWSRECLKDIAIELIFTLYDNDLNESNIDIDELLERLNLDEEE